MLVQNNKKIDKLFLESLCTKGRQQQVVVLEEMLFHERLFIIKQQQVNFIGEQKQLVRECLDLLRLLQWCGFGDDVALCQSVLSLETITDSKELLLCLHRSPFASDVHWRRVVKHMIEHKFDGVLDVLIHAINTAIQLKSQVWFDNEKYTDMLLRSREYATFPKISDANRKAKWSKYNATLLKEYLYKDPESTSELFSIASSLAGWERSFCRYIVPLKNHKPNNSNICFFINENQISYQIKFEGIGVITILCEENLSQRISEEELDKLKNLLDSEPDYEELKARKYFMADRMQPESFFSKLKKINPQLPHILDEIAAESTPDSRLREEEIKARQKCEDLVLSHQCLSVMMSR